LLLSRTSGNSITSNTFKNNHHSAILLHREAKNNNFTDNLLTDNGSLGIGFIDRSENNTFENNQVSNHSRLGIYLNSDSNRLMGNKITGNSEGIFLDSCHKNSIVKNSISENKKNGLWVYKSNGNTLKENSFRTNATEVTSENDFYGLMIEASSGNLLKDNLLADNGYNFGLFGWEDQDFNNDIDTSNLINSKPILILRDVNNRVVDSSSSASTIYCLGCHQVTIKDLNLEKQLAGVFLRKSRECKIENVRAGDNLIGIYGQFSTTNTIEDVISSNNRFGILLSPLNGCQNEICQANLIKGSSLAKNYYGFYYNTNETKVIGNTLTENEYGVWIQGPNGLVRNNTFSGNQTGITAGDSKGTHIYNNNFLNNKIQAKFLRADFSLNQPAPTGGNFWSDWSGPDNNNDGFVDFPYAVTTEIQDGFPWANESGWVPKTSASLSGIKGNRDWYLSDVTLNLAASDDKEVIKTEYSFNRKNWEIYSRPVQIITEGEKKIYYRSVDNDGNEEKTNQLEVRIDKTPPMVSGKVTEASNSSGWYNNDVQVEFSASDQLSGIDKNPPPITLSKEGKNQEVTGTAIDLAGNKAAYAVREINIDKTPPQITINSPTEKGEYLLNQNLLIEWSATDELSGIATASSSDPSGRALKTQTVGKKIFKVFAKDKAGNEGTKILDYAVKYDFVGFLPSIKNQEGYRPGSIIPIKFQLKDANGNSVTKATARLEIISQSGREREATSVDQKDNSFRYDPSEDNYFFNLDTKILTYGVWQLRVRLDDDSLQFTNLTLK
jgi:parallel beta-helix repeat protein